LLGYRKLESEIPTGYKATKSDDPYPVDIFGEDKPISDSKIGSYLNDDFYFYLNIYKNTKSFGIPHLYTSWLDAPRWLLQLMSLFDDITHEYELYKKSKRLA
jgi:hypothetical protein